MAANRSLQPHDARPGDGHARLETDRLYAIIGVVASSPDLDGVLEGVVNLITEATNCHACFVYLREGDTLRMRSASPIYAHLVGQVALGIDEGLTGWVARTRTSAFIRDNALKDPRFKLVSGIHEERFQSLVAVPIPARSGDALGVIMLHSEAPREFDEEVLTFLEHTASLVAGAIENARLLEQARVRVDALTALAGLGQRIAAVTVREELYRAVTEGVRSLLGCEVCALHVLGRLEGQLVLAATDPPTVEVPWANVRDTSLLLGTLRREQRPKGGGASRRTMLVATIAAGQDDLGVLVAAGQRDFTEDEDELLRAVASQVAVALKRTELIERLTTENLTREVFNAMASDDDQLARVRARAAGFDLDQPHLVLDVRPPRTDTRAWPATAKRLAGRLRRVAPGASYELEPQRLRALTPIRGDTGLEPLRRELDQLAKEEQVLIGCSDLRRGGDAGSLALRQAEDAALIAQSLREEGGALSYDELGAYKYLVRMTESDTPRDRHAAAVERIAVYDRRRRSELLKTLGEYLHRGRSPVATARALHIHPNTLRQRLERIEKLAELDLAQEDLLSLELAIKLQALRPAVVPAPDR